MSTSIGFNNKIIASSKRMQKKQTCSLKTDPASPKKKASGGQKAQNHLLQVSHRILRPMFPLGV